MQDTISQQCNKSNMFLILASGKSSRMKGRHKGLLEIQDKPLIKWHLDNIKASNIINNIVIVCSEQNIRLYRDMLDNYSHIKFKLNPAPERGMFSSVIEGLSLFDFQKHHIAYIGNVDCSIQRDTISRLMVYYNNIDVLTCRESLAIIPNWKGKKGHPKLINDISVKKIIDSNADNRLDYWIEDNTTIFRMPAESETVTMNINTIEDFKYWEGKYLSGNYIL